MTHASTSTGHVFHGESNRGLATRIDLLLLILGLLLLGLSGKDHAETHAGKHQSASWAVGACGVSQLQSIGSHRIRLSS